MSESDDDKRKKLAKEIVKEFFSYIDTQIGQSVRKKIIYVVLAIIAAGAVSLGIIKIPGVLE